MRVAGSTINTIVTILAVPILVAAIPSTVRDTFETGRVYLFSRQFLEELPQRLTGPGRLRFMLQPLAAIFLGWRSGVSHARTAQPASGEVNRKDLLRSALADLGQLLAIAIVLDAVAQLLIYRQVHPGAALVVGPVLIAIPYAVARTLTTRVVRLTQRDTNG